MVIFHSYVSLPEGTFPTVGAAVLFMSGSVMLYRKHCDENPMKLDESTVKIDIGG